MTKAELNQLLVQKTGLNQTEISLIIESLFLVIKKEISNGNKITFKGFGTFLSKKRAAKKVQLIKENRTISISEFYIPAFVPSKFFIEKK